mmetsp:Transcript_24953/g.38403  ORF Transcript_24953/g.38403 Transcript_24953/m.38403 type:complete len:204 (+) Transcript_24953:80-691(+)
MRIHQNNKPIKRFTQSIFRSRKEEIVQKNDNSTNTPKVDNSDLSIVKFLDKNKSTNENKRSSFDSDDCTCATADYDSSSSSLWTEFNDDTAAPHTTEMESNGKGRVSFGICEIREYQVIIGDHPSCKSGLPISLGWKHAGTEVVDIDEYEFIRAPFRSERLSDLYLDEQDRLAILHEVSGYSWPYLECRENLQDLAVMRGERT